MKRLLLPVLLAVLAFPASAPADEKADQILKQLTEISKRLDQMNKDMESRSASTAADIAKLRADVDALNKKVNDIQRTPAPVVAQVEPKKDDPPKYYKDIKVTETPSVDLPPVVPLRYTPPPVKTVPFLPDIKNGDATVLIKNTWSSTATVYVNGDYYRVAPGTSQSVRVIPGTFTYYVVEVHGYNAQSRTISPDETYTINVYPLTPAYSTYSQPTYYYPCR
jgi:hypothetical protein